MLNENVERVSGRIQYSIFRVGLCSDKIYCFNGVVDILRMLNCCCAFFFRDEIDLDDEALDYEIDDEMNENEDELLAENDNKDCKLYPSLI